MNGLERLESNGITAYIDPGLREFLEGYGGVNIDYVTRDFGTGGYIVTTGNRAGGGCSDDCSCS
ncbi:MAG: hypothetical protein AB1644_10980 [Candidatus Zixiibacteriota bacterium]